MIGPESWKADHTVLKRESFGRPESAYASWQGSDRKGGRKALPHLERVGVRCGIDISSAPKGVLHGVGLCKLRLIRYAGTLSLLLLSEFYIR